MQPNSTLDISLAPRRASKTWKPATITWQELIAWMDTPAAAKECGNYLMGRLNAPNRSKTTIATRSALTLDVDFPDDNFLDLLRTVVPYAFIVHSTFSSEPDNPRYRVIIPTDRDMYPDEYHFVAENLMKQIGIEQFDAGTVQPERYMFKPSVASGRDFFYEVNDTEPLPVDEFLDGFEEDLSSSRNPRISPNKRDPFTLDGVVGAFNRAYSFEEVIKEYDLPYEQQTEDLWKLRGARSEAGGRIIGEGLFFSHHITDPAYGQTCSAFDLVRLHLYGHLDEDVPEKTPVNRRPSHREMLEAASVDKRVIAEIVGADFASEMDDVVQESNWRINLRLSPRTGAVEDKITNWDLIVANDPVFTGLQYNEMTLSVETTTRDLPWRTVKPEDPTFTGVDRVELLFYLEREYGIRSTQTHVDNLTNTSAHQRRHNPVRDYLNSLVWDGVPRVETCLPGVEPTTYTRLVARKVMTAAVARILNPGIKWDHTIVITGPEGLGKTYWIDKMSRGFTVNLGPLNNKDTLIAMQRAWIVVADEGHSLRKADADVMKEFLTRTNDIFRMPYDRETTLHKRHSVIWSTTNDEIFLRRQEGNRRFLIVRSTRQVDFDSLTDEYIGQVWAEATHLYKNGERLYLDDSERDMAAINREEFTEEDALQGVIRGYLDTLVPADWKSMSPESRRTWLQNRADNMVPEGTHSIMEVCSAQIWVEALGRRLGEQRRIDLLEISTALDGLEGWTREVNPSRVEHYGPQRIFRRLSNPAIEADFSSLL